MKLAALAKTPLKTATTKHGPPAVALTDRFWHWRDALRRVRKVVARASLGYLAAVLVSCIAVMASGCSGQKSKADQSSGAQEFLIFAGAGLRVPVAELADTFGKENGVKVLTDYAGAEVLISKAKLSKRGDIYVPGDKEYVDLAAAKGLILSQKSVAYFVPTILVQKGNPQEISGLKDLTRPGIKLGLGDAQYIPIGRKSRRIFEKNGIAWSAIETNLKFQSATVNELCLQIQAKSLDAVIVWDAVAHCYAKYGDQVTIPGDQNVVSTVDAGVLAFTRNRDLAEVFVDFLRSERGRTIFRKHHYRVDPPE